MATPPAPPPHISVAVGITVGLLASFVQSLGLTIQRKSHLANEALPSHDRKRDYKRPLWLAGFLIFISSNLFGTIFQIGALPIVVLGPLGAVSLLWNAFFARFILGDEFSVHLAAGIVLIAGGAVMIGIFGAIPEVTHSLDELVRLYTRPPFLIWISLLSFTLAAIAVLSHFAEWALERRIARLYPSAPPLTHRPKSHHREWKKRRWSRPSMPSKPAQSAPALMNSSPGVNYGAFEERRPSRTRHDLALMDRTTGEAAVDHPHGRANGNDGQLPSLTARKAPGMSINLHGPDEDTAKSNAAMERSRLILGVAYGGVSGTLSGLCLLFAKTGIELLILTVVGQNQFGRVEAWLIVLVLLVAAVLQLFYLNRALRLVGPTLVCPLAFCFYNISSIVSGLIYYDQWDELSGLQFGLVSLGTVILLAGVWTVSIKAEPKCDLEDEDEDLVAPASAAGFTDEPESLLVLLDNSDSDDSDEEPVEWIPRGLTIGIGAASPGFDIRPAHRRHSHSRHHRRTSSSLSAGAVITPLGGRGDGHGDDSERTGLLERTASEADLESAGQEVDRRRASRERHERGVSLSGALYVGRRDSTPAMSGDEDASPGAEGGLLDSPRRRRFRKFTPLNARESEPRLDSA